MATMTDTNDRDDDAGGKDSVLMGQPRVADGGDLLGAGDSFEPTPCLKFRGRIRAAPRKFLHGARGSSWAIAGLGALGGIAAAWTGPRPAVHVATTGSGSPQTTQDQEAKRWTEDMVPQEEGVVGRVVKDVQDVIALDKPVHEDQSGRALHLLLDVAGVAGEGWALSWRDTRNGNLGLFLGRLALDGTLREPERPFPIHGAAFRELDPAMAAGPKLAGAVGYTLPGITEPWRFMGRVFHGDGEFQGPQAMLGVGDERLAQLAELHEAERSGREELGLTVTVDERGTATFAWLRKGRIFLQDLPADGGEGGKVRCANARGAIATGRPVFSSPGGKQVLLVWPSVEGNIAGMVLGTSAVQTLGEGLVLQALTDPRPNAGWWLVVDRGRELVLRPIAARGTRTGDDIVLGQKPWGHVHVATWQEGLAILEQRDASRGREVAVGGRFQVRFLAADGSPSQRPPLDPLAPETTRASAGRVAGAGNSLLIAWSELRGNDNDIYARILASDAQEPTPERRVNTDEASAGQKTSSVAAAGGDRAVITWCDSRDKLGEPYLRVVDAKGKFMSPELLLPAALPSQSGTPARPDLGSDTVDQVLSAMLPSGKFLACWSLTRESDRRLRAQLFAKDGVPLGPDFDVEADVWTAAPNGIAVQALGEREGFAVAWPMRDSGYVVRRITSEGGLGGAPRKISEVALAGDISLAKLNDGRTIAVWDEPLGDGNQYLRARFLGPDLAPEAECIEFDRQWRGSDHDPSVAPGPPQSPGSFALAWVVGEDASRDVFFRLFDGHGKPSTKPVSLTTKAHEQDYPCLVQLPDHAWICGWEDDLSYLDHTYVRRIESNGRTLGPPRNLNQRQEGVYHENYQAPILALVERGVVASWNDCRRAKGFDIYYKVFGLDFDNARAGD